MFPKVVKGPGSNPGIRIFFFISENEDTLHDVQNAMHFASDIERNSMLKCNEHPHNNPFMQ
jgi:hypothetical protein